MSSLKPGYCHGYYCGYYYAPQGPGGFILEAAGPRGFILEAAGPRGFILEAAGHGWLWRALPIAARCGVFFAFVAMSTWVGILCGRVFALLLRRAFSLGARSYHRHFLWSPCICRYIQTTQQNSTHQVTPLRKQRKLPAAAGSFFSESFPRQLRQLPSPPCAIAP